MARIVGATEAQITVADSICQDMVFEDADDVVFSVPDENGIVQFTLIGGSRDGDTYFIYPNGDIES